MRRRHSAHAGDEAAAVRFAWCAAFFATLTLVAALGLAKSAQAAGTAAARYAIREGMESPGIEMQD